MQNFNQEGWGFLPQQQNSNVGKSIFNNYIMQKQKEEAEKQRKLQEEAAKRKKDSDFWGNILSVGGAILGNTLLPGIGGAIGGALGGMLKPAGGSEVDYTPYMQNLGGYLLNPPKNTETPTQVKQQPYGSGWSGYLNEFIV